MEARGNLKLVRDWNGNKEGGWCSQVKVENVFHFESSFSCFPLFLLFSSRPSWHQNCKLRWESLMTHFACFDLSVPVANWFLVLEASGSASISLVTVITRACFQEISRICEVLLVNCIWSKCFLGQPWAGPDRELIPEPRSSQTSVPAFRAVLLFEASCFQEVVLVLWSPLAVSF